MVLMRIMRKETAYGICNPVTALILQAIYMPG
jgi:hypothetical protein